MSTLRISSELLTKVSEVFPEKVQRTKPTLDARIEGEFQPMTLCIDLGDEKEPDAKTIEALKELQLFRVIEGFTVLWKNLKGPGWFASVLTIADNFSELAEKYNIEQSAVFYGYTKELLPQWARNPDGSPLHRFAGIDLLGE